MDRKNSIGLFLNSYLLILNFYTRYGILVILIRIPRLMRRYCGKWLRQALGIQTFRFWIKN